MKTDFIKPIFAGLLAIAPFAFLANANAQQAPNSCNDAIPTCPPAKTHDLSQLQAADVTASVTINGTSITFSIPNWDGTTQPATVTANDIASSSNAIGNTITVQSVDTTPVNYSSDQTVTSNISSTNTLTTLAAVPGLTTMVGTAYGNSTQGKTVLSGMDFHAIQNSSGIINTVVSANTAPGVGVLTMNSQSSANMVATSGEYGTMNTVSGQNNNSTVTADTNAIMCCNVTSASLNALATGNTTVNASSSSTAYSWIAQNNIGNITAKSKLTTDAGAGLNVTSQAAGNSGFLDNHWGYSQLEGYQYQNGNLSANASLTAKWFKDTAIAGSAAQGNSLVLSSIASDGRILATQVTDITGTIGATTDFFTSTDFGVGTVTASAAGNGLVGFACSACGSPGIGIYGDTMQTNGANSTATINMNNSGAGWANAYGVAAGNSATFIAQNGQSVH